MITIRKLEYSDSLQLEGLIGEIESNLENNLFWLPISDKSRDRFFDDTWTYFIGAYDNNTLVAAIGLFFNENEYGENTKALHLSDKNCAELGRAMVKPEYRNQGLMGKLSEMLIEYAKNMKIENIIATAHPDNKPSQKILKGLNFSKQKSIIKNNTYARDIFLKKLNKENKNNEKKEGDFSI